MMKNLFFIPLLTVLFLAGNNLRAQDAHGVVMLARASEQGNIMLRWAPKSSVSWELGNKFGYTIERYTVTKDGELVSPPTLNVLAPVIIKPAAEQAFEPLIDEDDYVAIVAQAVYGETFEVTENFTKDVFQIVQKTRERDLRYSMLLFACDQSFEAAGLAGLGHTDYNVQSGEKYLYRIYANVPASIQPMDTANVYLSIDDQAPLPAITAFEAEFGDRQALLSWEKTFTDKFYNAFIIEKSTDGGRSYRSITEKPIVNAYSNDDKVVSKYVKVDTLSSNGARVWYRIAGVNPFGEQGPYSEPVVGAGKTPLNAFAAIRSHKINPDGSAVINWEYPNDQETWIQGFTIQVANTAKGPFETITRSPIARQLRSYRINRPQNTGYYRMGLWVEGEGVNHSFPYLIQLEDSIPPATPVNVAATIAEVNETGVVNMSWDPNDEEDFWGYRVYRSNFKSAEFSEVTTDPLQNPSFEDSVALNSLTENIYYHVVAVDTRNNRSEPSEVVELTKPDIVPPSPPVFKSVESRKEGAYLEWARSSSEDVASYDIYRLVSATSQWERISTVREANWYLDDQISPGSTHTYSLVAVDDAGLESPPVRPMRVGRKRSAYDIRFKNLTGRSERDNERIILFWKVDNEAVDKVKVYRSVGEAPVSLYKVVAEEGQFIDEAVQQNSSYSYQLRAVLADDRDAGEFSKKLEIKY
ncbi:MAG: hypothetical protein AAGA66_04105 [Bacteroidota bacterium]